MTNRPRKFTLEAVHFVTFFYLHFVCNIRKRELMGIFDPIFPVWEPKFRDESNSHLNTATSCWLQCIQWEGSDVNQLKACLNYLIPSSTIKYHVQNPLEMRTCLDHLNYFRVLNVDPVPGSQTWFASRLGSIRPHSSIKIRNTCSLSIIKLSLSGNENKWLRVCRNFKYNYWPAAVLSVPNRNTYSVHVVSSLS